MLKSLLKQLFNKQYRAYMQKVRLAKRLWKESGRRHFVINVNGKYFVWNKTSIDVYNQGKPKKARITADEVIDAALYVTPIGTYHNI